MGIVCVVCVHCDPTMCIVCAILTLICYWPRTRHLAEPAFRVRPYTTFPAAIAPLAILLPAVTTPRTGASTNADPIARITPSSASIAWFTNFHATLSRSKKWEIDLIDLIATRRAPVMITPAFLFSSGVVIVPPMIATAPAMASSALIAFVNTVNTSFARGWVFLLTQHCLS